MTRRADLATRVLDATYHEVAEHGLGALAVERVAIRAGSSRATIYRHFPGGREELIARAIAREVERFLTAVLSDSPPAEEGVARHVAGVVRAAHRLLAAHTVLQRLLADEADAIVPSLATVQSQVASGLVQHLADVFTDGKQRGEVEADADPVEAAEHCARLLLSYVGSAGRWDLADPSEAERLVRDRVLVGVLRRDR